MKEVSIFTDGACSGNPGAGGWAVILRYGEVEKELCGGEVLTTNNRMELTAVIQGLKALKFPCKVDLYSDSRYVLDALEQGWAEKWKHNNWMRNKKEKALNADLWEVLLTEIHIHEVMFHWVKGHDGHVENERCDKLAVEQSHLFAEKLGALENL